MKLYKLKSLFECQLILAEFKKKGWTDDLTGQNLSLENAAKRYFDKYPNLNFSNQNISGYSDNAMATEDAKWMSLSDVFGLIEDIIEELELNKEHKATVMVDGSVRVGCQTFKPETVLALAKIVQRKLAKKA